MRALFLFAAALALSGCGNNDQADKTMNVDENLTAENIVSNDVTAIDAVTGDAANMAADVDMNFGNLDMNAGEMTSNQSAEPARPARSAPRATAPAAESNSSAATVNTTANAE